MKYLILILLTISFNSLADYDQCKSAGKEAREIMIKRQVQKDVFKTLDLYKENKEIVFAAYDVRAYDITKQLAKAINARNPIVYADELRKYEQIKSDLDSELNKFELKYIRLCIESK